MAGKSKSMAPAPAQPLVRAFVLLHNVTKGQVIHRNRGPHDWNTSHYTLPLNDSTSQHCHTGNEASTWVLVGTNHIQTMALLYYFCSKSVLSPWPNILALMVHLLFSIFSGSSLSLSLPLFFFCLSLSWIVSWILPLPTNCIWTHYSSATLWKIIRNVHWALGPV